MARRLVGWLGASRVELAFRLALPARHRPPPHPPPSPNALLRATSHPPSNGLRPGGGPTHPPPFAPVARWRGRLRLLPSQGVPYGRWCPRRSILLTCPYYLPSKYPHKIQYLLFLHWKKKYKNTKIILVGNISNFWGIYNK